MKHPTKLKSKLNKHRSFFRKMLDPTDRENSSKRFVTLIVSLHFILASFMILTLFGVIVFMNVKGNIELITVVSHNLTVILEYDFYIILGGLGFITMEQFAVAIIERAKAIVGLNSTGVLDPTTSDTTTTGPLVEEIPS